MTKHSKTVSQTSREYSSCNKCHKKKEITQFSWRYDGSIPKPRKTCRVCWSNSRKRLYRSRITYELKQKRDKYHANPHEYYLRNIKNKYNLTREDYETLWKKQGGLCAICREPEPRYKHLSVDHSHATKAVRGLLCSNCNIGLGCIRERVDVARNMVIYILRNCK